MKTPLEAIDEAISKLTALRAVLIRPQVQAEAANWHGLSSSMLFHFCRPDGEVGDIESARCLARSLDCEWGKNERGGWESTLCGIPIFIHNAEPARNPQPETVEL